MNVLITGTSSGLGKYLLTQFEGADSFSRDSKIGKFAKNHYDLVIHSAATVAHYNWSDEIPY